MVAGFTFHVYLEKTVKDDSPSDSGGTARLRLTNRDAALSLTTLLEALRLAAAAPLSASEVSECIARNIQSAKTRFGLFSCHHVCNSNLIPSEVHTSTRRYLLLQLFFNIVPLDRHLTISLESFVELVSDVPFHAVFCTNITDAAGMDPGSGTVCYRGKCEQN